MTWRREYVCFDDSGTVTFEEDLTEKVPRMREYCLIDGSSEEEFCHTLLMRQRAFEHAQRELEQREGRAAREVLRMLGED